MGYVGASYEGYETEVLALLKAIDSRIPRQVSEEGVSKKMGKSEGRGSSELKGLVSSIDYDSASVQQNNNQERALCLSQ